VLDATRPTPAPALRGARAEFPRLEGLATAAPETALGQAEMLDLLGLAGDPFAESIFARCGVAERRLEVSADLLRRTLQERTPDTEAQLLRLAGWAIDRLELDPADIGVVITATYYSLGGPTLAHRLVERYELGPDTDKYHLVGVGCASAVPLFRLAGQALRERPGETALVVAAESVTGFLTPVGPEDGRDKVVGSALFGDGCAAALLARSEDASGPSIVATAVHQVPGTLDHVRFAVSGADSHMQISRALPELAEWELESLVTAFLGDRGLAMEDVDHWLVHPGGRGIVEGIRRGLGLSDEQVAVSMDVLSELGNVGTPASFFVLAATLERHRPVPGDHGLMVTIGPGVTVGLMLLAW
jgi:predicted naringenin-chalcone synthase